MRQLAAAQDVELMDPQTKEAYELVAERLNFCCIGAHEKDTIKNFLSEPGTLADGKWKELAGDCPASERAECWWVKMNEDESQPPRLLCADLASLLLQLKQHRVATVSRLAKEKARRVQGNESAANVFRDYPQLWCDAQGPAPEELVDPTEIAIESAKAAADLLRRYVADGSLAHPSLARFTKEDQATIVARLHQAAASLQGTGWGVIRRERFSCTPDGLWEEITKGVDTAAERYRGMASRCAARAASRTGLPEPACDIDDEDCEWDMPVTPAAATRDPRLDPDEFKQTSGGKPYNWNHAVDMASEVHMASMRLLLEAR